MVEMESLGKGRGTQLLQERQPYQGNPTTGGNKRVFCLSAAPCEGDSQQQWLDGVPDRGHLVLSCPIVSAIVATK